MKTNRLSLVLNSRQHTARAKSAFTLIELLVVVGLIAVLAAGIGVAMKDGNPTSALRAGQNTLVGLLSGARGQAALNQTDAMIIVDVTDPEEETFLRSLQVVVKSGSGWKPVGVPVTLPQGIYLVPPANFSQVTFTGSWDNKRKSDGFASATPAAIDPADPANDQLAEREFLQFLEFKPLGTTSGTGRLLVTTGKRTGPATIELDNSAMLRGVTVSRYGVPTFINEAETFDKISQP